MVRLKHRYITAQILPNERTFSSSSSSGDSLNQNMLQSTLRDKIRNLFGDVGSGDFGGSTYVRFFDSEYSQIMVIRTTREGESNVHFALSCITKIESSNAKGGSNTDSINDSFIIRTLCVNSCVRTCMKSLRETFKVYLDHYNQATKKQADELSVATVASKIEIMLNNTEL